MCVCVLIRECNVCEDGGERKSEIRRVWWRARADGGDTRRRYGGAVGVDVSCEITTHSCLVTNNRGLLRVLLLFLLLFYL